MLVGVQHGFQAARVIEVAVADHDHFRTVQGDVQLRGIVAKDLALPRIEENTVSVGLDPERQAVLGQQVDPANRILS